MIYEHSNTYIRFPDELEGRLDFSHNHPSLDLLDSLETLTPFEVCPLSQTLVDMDEIISGTTPRNMPYLENGIPFLGASNVRHDRMDLSGVTRIPTSYHQGALSSSQLQRGDVLITMAGAIGRCCVFNTDEEANINQALARVRVDIQRVVPAFLSKYLNSHLGQLGFVKHRHDVGQPNINLEEIKILRVILPEIFEQERILEKIAPLEREASFFHEQADKIRQAAADILPVELDLSFSATDEICYFFKTGEEKSSIVFHVDADEVFDRMQYLFFHPRYRVLEEVTQKLTCATLKQAMTVPIRRGEQPEYEEDGEVMVLKTIDLKNGSIDYKNALRVSREFFESKPTAQIKRGDILMASTGYGSLGKIDVYEGDDEAMVDAHISILRPNLSYDAHFLAYYLRSYIGQLQIEKWFSGSSGQIEIQPNDLNQIIIPTADEKGVSLDEQKRIAELVSKRLEEASSLEAQAAAKWTEARETFERMLLKGVE